MRCGKENVMFALHATVLMFALSVCIVVQTSKTVGNHTTTNFVDNSSMCRGNSFNMLSAYNNDVKVTTFIKKIMLRFFLQIFVNYLIII